MKNINAIEKIISEMSFRDFNASWNKLTKEQKRNVRDGKFNFSYSLSPDTLEALDIKHDYLSGKIDENTYKAYCLRYNLLAAEGS